MVAPRMTLPKTSLPKAALAKRSAVSYALPKQKRMTRGRWIAAIAVLLFIGLGAAWFTGLIGSDPRLAEIRDLRERSQDQSLSEQDRRAARDEMVKKWQELPEDVRFKAMQNAGPRGGMGRDRGPQRVNQLLAMPVDKRNAELDKQIDQEIEMRKRFEEMAKNGQGPFGGQGGSGGQGGPGGRGGPGGGPGGPQGGANKWMNARLSSTPADTRATFGIYRQLMQVRKIQRGMQ
jgi:hypothetical protein